MPIIELKNSSNKLVKATAHGFVSIPAGAVNLVLLSYPKTLHAGTGSCATSVFIIFSSNCASTGTNYSRSGIRFYYPLRDAAGSWSTPEWSSWRQDIGSSSGLDTNSMMTMTTTTTDVQLKLVGTATGAHKFRFTAEVGPFHGTGAGTVSSSYA